MEYIDIYNNLGEKTNRCEERVSAHMQGLLHKSICVWILNSKYELLLQKRSPDKLFAPDMWDISFSGHISSGEAPIDAVLREGKEELGVDICLEKLEYLFSSRSYDKTDHYIENEIHEVYLYKDDIDIKDYEFVDNEVAEIRYIPYKEVEEMFQRNQSDLVIYTEHYTSLFLILDKMKLDSTGNTTEY